MIEILLVCYITFNPFNPAPGWTIAQVNNKEYSAAITLKKQMSSGETLIPPEGCRLDEPKRYEGLSGGSILLTPGQTIPWTLPNR